MLYLTEGPGLSEPLVKTQAHVECLENGERDNVVCAPGPSHYRQQLHWAERDLGPARFVSVLIFAQLLFALAVTFPSSAQESAAHLRFRRLAIPWMPMTGGSGEAAMSPPSSGSGGGGKRGRDPEEDVYVDNLHSHKRYLSEVRRRLRSRSPPPPCDHIMASSLNGLSVGDSLPDNIMESPARSDTASIRDEILSQYSPMSEDPDDYRCYDTQLNPNMSQADPMISPSTSPMSSPHRHQKPQSPLLPSNPYPLPSCSLSSVVCAHARRGCDNEGRFPSSPNDMCHGADLRRTALLRSVQMRVHGPHAYDYSFRQEHEHAHEHDDEHRHDHLEGLEGTERQPSCRKSIDDESFQRPDHDFGQPEHEIDYIGNCPSGDCPSDPKFKQDDKNNCKYETRMDNR